MRTLVCLLLCATATYGLLMLRKQSYTKFPYNLNNNFGLLRNAAHKAAYHAQNNMLYVIGAQTDVMVPRMLFIVSLIDVRNPQIVYTHSFDPVENGRVNDIAVCPDMVAVTLESPSATKEGHVELFTPFRRGDTTFTRTHREIVGVDPKGLAFSSDCQKLVIANEGRGGKDAISGAFVDPVGSVTIMLRNDIGSPAFVTIDFRPTLQGREREYQDKGVRWVYQGNHNQGIINNMWDDMEPESVSISLDQRFAYVSLPENNAVARIDMNTYSVNEIFPLGYKNWTTYEIDGSDQDGGPNFRSGLPLYSMYQATDLVVANLNNQEYLITANQGQIKRYTSDQLGTDAFDESRRARTVAIDADFDELNWPEAMKSAVRDNTIFGRLPVRYTDAFDFISRQIKDCTTYGGRSVSLWQTSTMTLVYDTGNELASQEFAKYASTFNGEASNANLSPAQQRDLRSDDFGPEPTSVGVGEFGGQPLVAVGTRTGHIHLYRDQLLLPVHQSVYRDGLATSDWSTLYNNNQAGDVIISDIGIINASDSPDGMTLVWVIGAGSGTLSLYEVYSSGTGK